SPAALRFRAHSTGRGRRERATGYRGCDPQQLHPHSIAALCPKNHRRWEGSEDPPADGWRIQWHPRETLERERLILRSRPSRAQLESPPRQGPARQRPWLRMLVRGCEETRTAKAM